MRSPSVQRRAGFRRWSRQCVDRVAGDSECRSGSFRDEHERKRVKRSGPSAPSRRSPIYAAAPDPLVTQGCLSSADISLAFDLALGGLVAMEATCIVQFRPDRRSCGVLAWCRPEESARAKYTALRLAAKKPIT